MKETLIIIPSYNNLDLLKNCIKHIEELSTKDFDVLIVDNGSNDETVSYILSLENDKIKYHHILLNINLGFATACNKGFLFSINNGYMYSILLNNDAFIKNDFVVSLVNKISTHKKVFAVSSLMLSKKTENKIDDYGDFYNILGYAFQHLNGIKNQHLKDGEIFSACGGASIYNNQVLQKIGFFDDIFFAYLEDIDLSYRAKLYGYKNLNCKDAKCTHIGSATSGSKYNEFKVRISARNNILLIYKNMPTIMILLNILPLFIGHLLKFIYFILKGFGIDYFFGIVDGFKTLNDVKRVNFSKIPFYRFIKIEIELIFNTFLYIIEYGKRKGIC